MRRLIAAYPVRRATCTARTSTTCRARWWLFDRSRLNGLGVSASTASRVDCSPKTGAAKSPSRLSVDFDQCDSQVKKSEPSERCHDRPRPSLATSLAPCPTRKLLGRSGSGPTAAPSARRRPPSSVRRGVAVGAPDAPRAREPLDPFGLDRVTVRALATELATRSTRSRPTTGSARAAASTRGRSRRGCGGC